ncbi:MAG: WecB/TagA/CpsF family glycosyltransferase [Patescibacteria group bacterium]|nr:WecB/TagA/CpsF family glycosyltransferase [Patescibacteria group bacterium]
MPDLKVSHSAAASEPRPSGTEILGVRIHDFTTDEIERRMRLWLAGTGPHLVVTPNPEMLVAAHKDPGLQAILNQASLAVADGYGLILASRVLQKPLRHRHPGVELSEILLRICASLGARVYFLGGQPGVAQQAAKVMSESFPGLVIAGATDGGDMTNPAAIPGTLIEHIQNAKPDVLIVGFGHGKQERFLAAHLAKFSTVRVAIGVGGALDFWSGRIRRAPLLMRRLGLEWVYRLLRQPSRFSRIVQATLVFPYLVLKTQIFHHHVRN